MKQNRQQYVKVTSDFVEKSLSSAAVKVLLLLASIAQANGENLITVSNSRIAERTGLTNISRITKELCAAGAISERIRRFKNNRQKCNAFVLADAIFSPKRYVLVPVSSLNLPKSSLRLFLIYCIHANTNGRCLLSLSMIQEISGMARSTIVSGNKELTDRGFISKQQYIRREGNYGYNRIYLTHILRRRYGLRRSETFRVMICSGRVLQYESKCEAENSLQGNLSDKFIRSMKALFRSTRIAGFLRNIFRGISGAAVFLCKKWGSQKKNTRFINFNQFKISNTVTEKEKIFLSEIYTYCIHERSITNGQQGSNRTALIGR